MAVIIAHPADFLCSAAKQLGLDSLFYGIFSHSNLLLAVRRRLHLAQDERRQSRFHINFSNSLLRKQPRRSSARYPPPSTRHTFETDEYSMLPRGYAINQGQQGVVENEAPLERLRRLRFEVDQLEEELEHKQVPASSSRATASSPTARECPISYHAHTK
ncbi:hypothetical protein Pst134EA_002975 [Puccinia striiformis f. sp. tritici]|uniref:uncharacterized protein n=1 Tax=Puccinia striiformis f. sp. tritici TaxID=168172 RepID=UPI0020072AC4|nr:uncharacterized protein Pst134EA_031513 [Puccinia striiformis f. sp. tritici]XP_047811807.1 hypothetical protein Pst134EA_002975 [Puccinia striiformis f. sp. tritici]KAH9445259.1 hypothetical protein Pst134EA_031513 [Puccinia striiformis f. sp. tritici]KAH9472353.1 hypothetical protein Pst134EA_002975 [Puccinia striiformis f. sp. tritici]